MTLNANSLPSKKGNFENMEPGTYPTRLVGIVDLGSQAQRPYNGEDKPPAREIALTYEFVDVFMKDEDGKELTEKPRWVTEMIAFYPLTSTKAKSTERYHAFDSDEQDEGDWVKQISKPVNATVILNESKGKTYENIAGLSPMRSKDAEKCPPLVNEPIIFDFDTPDMAVFARIPKFIQDKIKGSLDYEGSELQKLLGKEKAPPKEEKKTAAPKKVAPKKTEDDDKDEIPY